MVVFCGKSEAGCRLALEVDLDQDSGLAAYDPRVMAGLDHDGSGRGELERATVRVFAGDRAAREKADVCKAAAIGSGLGSHVLRPTEADGVDGALDPSITGADDVDDAAADLASRRHDYHGASRRHPDTTSQRSCDCWRTMAKKKKPMKRTPEEQAEY